MIAPRLACASVTAVILGSAFAAASASGANLPNSGFDRRAGSARATVPGAARAARRELRADLGPRALLSVDRATGRPRVVGRLDGALTGPSSATNAEVALDYLHAHAAVYGLTSDQIDGLDVGVQHRAGDGLRSVQLTQSFGGVMSIDSGVRALLDARGRLIELVGSPDPRLDAAGTDAAVSRAQAALTAARASGAPGSAGDAQLSAVIFHVGPTARLGWRALVRVSPREEEDVLVDATSGAVVRRANLVLSANAASVYPAWPDAPLGGSPITVDLAPYLDAPAAPTKLRGPNAYAFTDAPDVVPGPTAANLTPAPGSDVGPSAGTDFLYPFNGLTLGAGRCPTVGATCAWDPLTPFSWQANRSQDAVQLFWLVNAFHDHLAAPPIGFVAADGAFEGDDPVYAQSMDGADTAGGLPDPNHLDNANFTTLPDGKPGLMQMYLFGGPPDPVLGPDRFFSVAGADDASIVYHEYTHGLSNRLVTDAAGAGALNAPQSGAMGEAWSDWYAFDELDREGNLSDAPGTADVRTGAYVEGTQNIIRSEPIDCPVGSDPACPGTPTAGAGGYTFGDLGKVIGRPEVHADGEIWGQTLWQLRDALIADHGRAAGIARIEQLVTDAMRLSPPEPSLLDQRNAILQADATDAPAGQDANTIWRVFATRGMGWFASVDSAFDIRAIEDFSLPPAPAAGSATVQGAVRDDGGSGLPSIAVGFTGHDTGLGPDLSAITDASGAYAIAGVPAGTYPKLRAAAPPGSVDGLATAVTVPATGSVTRDLVIRRNWASVLGGAKVRSFTGSDFGPFGCGPGQALDDDPATVWSTDAPGAPGVGGPKDLVVALPADVTVSAIAINPSPGCGDGPAAELGEFRVRVARDDAGDPGPFATVATGTFGPAALGSAADLPLSGTTPGVRYVDLQALGNNGDPLFMDVSELQVFGLTTTPAEGGGGTAAPEVTTLPADPAATTASSVTFRAAVTPHGASTVVRIAYGLAGDQLAFQTADVPVPGVAPQTLSFGAGGLLANTTYHYRAVAINAKGTATGEEQTVTTAVAPTPPPVPVATVGPSTTAPSSTARRAARVSCELRGKRTITCTFAARPAPTTRVRLSRAGHTLATGVVHGRVVRMRARRTVRKGSYVLTITHGRGPSASVRRRSVRL